MMIIYKITNKLNEKTYIGQTVRTLNERIGEHERHKKYPINHAIKKYGIDNFLIEVIYKCKTQKELDLMEETFIWLYGSNIKALGYNIENGGNGRGKMSKETKDKLRKAQMDYQKTHDNPFKGLKHTENALKKMRIAAKDRVFSKDTCEKISKANSGCGNGRAKLTAEDVYNIRHEYESGIKIPPISKKYNVTYCTIRNIVQYMTWNK